MREKLKELMRVKGDDAYSLEAKSGVPQPTTQRFLTGKHGDPRSSTVKKWANAYGLTENQFRDNQEGVSGNVVEFQPESDPILDDLDTLDPIDADVFRTEIASLEAELAKVRAKIRAAAKTARIKPEERMKDREQEDARDPPIEERRTA